MIRIRKEEQQDIEAVHEVNVRAFGRRLEADLVDKLRNNPIHLLSLVAVEESEIVGHILFSPVTVENANRKVEGMGLGPVSVPPENQRQGIGSNMIRAGITILNEQQCPFITVLGRTDYYPRFGFEPASRHGIRSEWKVPDDVFMILVLKESEMHGVSGVAKYLPEFAETM